MFKVYYIINFELIVIILCINFSLSLIYKIKYLLNIVNKNNTEIEDLCTDNNKLIKLKKILYNKEKKVHKYHKIILKIKTKLSEYKENINLILSKINELEVNDDKNKQDQYINFILDNKMKSLKDFELLLSKSNGDTYNNYLDKYNEFKYKINILNICLQSINSKKDLILNIKDLLTYS